MTKKNIAAKMAEIADVSQSHALRMIDAFLEATKDALSEGDTVTLRGFGSFKQVASKERSGRNIKTGERVTIPSKLRVRFKNYMDETETGIDE